MSRGCSGTTSLGGKLVFFISFRCDGVLGPRARGAGCKLRCQTAPTESGRACWPHITRDVPLLDYLKVDPLARISY